MQIIEGGRAAMAGLAVHNRGWCCGSCLNWLSGTDPNDPAAAAAAPGSPQHAAAMYLDPNAAQHAASQHNGGPHVAPRGVQWDPALQQASAQHAPTTADGYPVPAVVPVNTLQQSNSLLRRKSGIPEV